MLPVLKKGMKSDAVRLFKALCGFTDTSGVFDAAFEKYVMSWQAERGLTADGIIGRLSWGKLLQEALNLEAEKSEPAKRIKPIDFKQYDLRWAGKLYSAHGDRSQTIKTSGCGPTAMADIVAAVKDASVTPPDLAEKALKWGDRTRSKGTAWRFFAHAADEYGFGYYEKSARLDKLQSCLDAGGWAVANMGKGYWTKGGHYICVWKIEGDRVHALDPASAKRTSQRTEDFMKERKMFFLFGE